jgi:hypothetical protein
MNGPTTDGTTHAVEISVMTCGRTVSGSMGDDGVDRHDREAAPMPCTTCPAMSIGIDWLSPR